MTRYSFQANDIWPRVFVKGYGFLSSAKNMGKSIGKKVSKNISGKYVPGMLAMRQKPLDHAKKSATDALKNYLKRIIQKTAEATGDLIGNKIANKIVKLAENHNKTI